jgi:hypothetical protein
MLARRGIVAHLRERSFVCLTLSSAARLRAKPGLVRCISLFCCPSLLAQAVHGPQLKR